MWITQLKHSGMKGAGAKYMHVHISNLSINSSSLGILGIEQSTRTLVCMFADCTLRVKEGMKCMSQHVLFHVQQNQLQANKPAQLKYH